MNTIKINKKNTQMIAHRGVSGLEKENTIPAFIAAGSRTYYGCECDVYLTLDRKVVILHDNNTERVSGIKENVKESNYDNLKQIKFFNVEGTKRCDYYYIPLLKEYLEICKRYEKIAVVEIKDNISEEDVLDIVNVVKEENYLENTVFISFYPWNLQKVRKHYPDQNVQFLSNDINEEIIDLCVRENFDIDLRHDRITKELIERFHSHGLKVNTFTVNDQEEAERFCEWGIDYITTNILE